MPGQFGPISRVLLPCMARFTLTMSFTGIPSVMQTARSSPASTASSIASPAKGGGTKIAEAVAPVCFAASATVSKTGTLSSKSWPPLPGVTPATICVPYSRLSFVCLAPKPPVMPWTRTRVCGVTRMDMGKFAIGDLRFTICALGSCFAFLTSFLANLHRRAPRRAHAGGTNILSVDFRQCFFVEHGKLFHVAFVNAKGVAVRIENHRHAADGCLDRFDAEFHV